MRRTRSKLDRLKFRQTPREGKDATIYVRVSEDAEIKDSDGNKISRASVKAQKKDLIAYAKENGWSYRVYDQDCDISGMEDTLVRMCGYARGEYVVSIIPRMGVTW